MSSRSTESDAMLSLEKARAYAFAYIPADASEHEARAWLRSQFPRIMPGALSLIVSTHLEDEILQGWRS